MNLDIGQRLGFMQGRLSPIVNGMIQAFPAELWRDEYAKASQLKLPFMEWTLDFDNIDENPLLLDSGRTEILKLNEKFNLNISTLTGDYIMQKPFYKAVGHEYGALIELMKRVLKSASLIGIKILVVPLVDNGRIETEEDKWALLEGIELLYPVLKKLNIKIAFESDYDPERLLQFIQLFDSNLIGINYDIGNSASLGYDWKNEIESYSQYIINVHVKDRKLNGTTVPLGSGAADIAGVIELLESKKYSGLYIFQTAPAVDGDDVGIMQIYKQYLLGCS